MLTEQVAITKHACLRMVTMMLAGKVWQAVRTAPFVPEIIAAQAKHPRVLSSETEAATQHVTH